MTTAPQRKYHAPATERCRSRGAPYRDIPANTDGQPARRPVIRPSGNPPQSRFGGDPRRRVVRVRTKGDTYRHRATLGEVQNRSREREADLIIKTKSKRIGHDIFCQQPSRSQPLYDRIIISQGICDVHRTGRLGSRPILAFLSTIEYVAESVELAPAELPRARRICYFQIGETLVLKKVAIVQSNYTLARDIFDLIAFVGRTHHL